MGTLEEILDDLLTSSWDNASTATRESWPTETRLDGAGVARVLRSHTYAVLGTTRPDGRPHVAPVSYAIAADASVWLPTTSGAVRLTNVAQQPWASFLLTEGEQEQHVVVLVEGVVRTLSVAQAKDEADEAGTELPSADWITTWITLRPSRLLAYAAAGAKVA